MLRKSENKYTPPKRVLRPTIETGFTDHSPLHATAMAAIARSAFPISYLPKKSLDTNIEANLMISILSVSWRNTTDKTFSD